MDILISILALIGFVIALVALAVFCLWRTARSWNHRVALG